jgi:predicted outer membrane protein
MSHVNPVQVQKFLKGVDYPASKATLLEKAKSMGADENVCASLEQLPDEEFQTPADVSQAFGRLPDDVGEGAQGGREPAREAKAERGHKEEPRAAKSAEGGRKEEARPAHKAEGGERKEEQRAAKAGERGHKEEPRAGQKAEGARKEEAHAAPKEHKREPARAEGGKRRYTGGNEFLIEAMQDSMAEIQICEMAIEKSDNQHVKEFAQSMIDEHGRMGRELEQLANDKQLDVPRTIRPEQEMTVDEFSSLEGNDFEQRWIQYNIDVHERDVKVFRHYADEEEDADIRDLAKSQCDTLGKHLKMAHEVGKRLAKH